MKTITFKRDTDALGFALVIATFERQEVRYEIEETPDNWIVRITGHKI